MQLSLSSLGRVFGVMVVLAGCITLGLSVAKAREEVTGGRGQLRVSGKVSIDGAMMMGGPGAQVAVIEFSDFECPACTAFARDSFAEVRSRYVESGQALFVFRHRPLSMHPNAFAAAEAAVCAAQQGRGWEMHDLLFAHSERLGSFAREELPAVVRIDPTAFRKCLTTAGRERVLADNRLGTAIGVNATPTFLIGRIVGTDVDVTETLSGAVAAVEIGKALARAARQ